MAEYKILFKKSVWKDFQSIPDKDLKKILNCIESLSSSPRLSGSQKLSGQERYRLRQRQYRIVFSIQDEELTVWVVKIGHRREIFR